MIKWKYFPQWNMCCTKIRLISRDARVELYKLSNNRYRVEWDSTMWRTKEFTAKDWKEAQATAIALIKRFIFESTDLTYVFKDSENTNYNVITELKSLITTSPAFFTAFNKPIAISSANSISKEGLKSHNL